MSVFEIEERESRTNPYISIKRLDERWKNFPRSMLLADYADKLDSYKNFSIRSDDIFVLGYPRSGTTRLQELVWIIANDFDFKTQLEYDCDTRIAFFE